MKHILIVGGIPLVPRELKAYPNTKMTLMIKLDEIDQQDLNCFHRVINLPKDASTNEWIATASFINKMDPFQAIACFDEMNQHITSVIANEIKLPFHSEDTINNTRDKYRMRKLLHENGIDNTSFKIVNNMEDIISFVKDFGYPIILKPKNGWASKGVSVIRKEEDIIPAINWYKEEVKENELYLEKFLSGQEFSVEAFSENGKHKIVCLTKQFNDNDHMIEVGHVIPATIKEDDEILIKNLLDSVLDALDIKNGPSHTEIILTDEGPRVVETHVRLAGDLIPDLINIASGTNLYELWARQILGEKVLEELEKVNFDKYTSIWFKMSEAKGVLVDVIGVEEIKSRAGVERVYTWKKGSTLKGLQHSFSRTGYVISSSASEFDAVESAKSSVESIRFLVEC